MLIHLFDKCQQFFNLCFLRKYPVHALRIDVRERRIIKLADFEPPIIHLKPCFFCKNKPDWLRSNFGCLYRYALRMFVTTLMQSSCCINKRYQQTFRGIKLSELTAEKVRNTLHRMAIQSNTGGLATRQEDLGLPGAQPQETAEENTIDTQYITQAEITWVVSVRQSGQAEQPLDQTGMVKNRQINIRRDRRFGIAQFRE